MKMIVAATHRRFLDWCRDNDVNPRDVRVRFVSDASKLRGLGPDTEIVCVGAWTDRADWREIYDVLQYLRATGRAK